MDRIQVKTKDNTQTKHNPEKANNVKHSKTQLAWFSHLLQGAARLVNIEVSSIADTLSPILFKYRCTYRQYL